MNINLAEYASILAAIGQQVHAIQVCSQPMLSRMTTSQRHVVLSLTLEVISTGIWSMATQANLWWRQQLEFSSLCLVKVKAVLTGLQSLRRHSIAEISSLFCRQSLKKSWMVISSLLFGRDELPSVPDNNHLHHIRHRSNSSNRVNVTCQGCYWSRQCIVSGKKYKKESCVLCR